ncbi:hypothetical protein TRIUR3_01349 [Triticum urartu]|uniref:At1g61320/AtMIF1 LRR domain-containing protein n=1 Tax=Triticum urartu TaxID=4572 RepID=M7ZMZ5_TRIUA|nr:hypothetical protein TRIUR3_01349 [Triticum urartu]
MAMMSRSIASAPMARPLCPGSVKRDADASMPMSAEGECSSRPRHLDQDSEAGGKRMKYSSGPDLPEVAITPVIEELSFQLSSALAAYSFPCSLLSDLSGTLIRHLHLAGCAFRPAAKLSCLRSLTQLHLYHVGIKEDELGCLLSSCPVLELFAFGNCSGITCLKIPCTLDRLRRLHIISCNALRAIESKAPNLFSFYFAGKRVQLSLGEPLQLEKLVLSHPQALDDARATLPSIAPNLQTLRITSCLGASNTMMHSRFLYLKFLSIWVHTFPFHDVNDYMSLVSFLDACPSLETFALTTPTEPMEHESIIGDPSHLRRMPGHRHGKLKSMKVLGFNSAKSLIELTVHIIENAGSLESLSLDTTYYAVRCSDGISDTCSSIRERTRMEAPRALLAIQTHIQGKVPSTVKLDVLEPCSRCHAS